MASMKFGLCLSGNKALMGIECGADYTEISGMKLYEMSGEEFAHYKQYVDSGKIITYSCNGLVAAEVRLTGEVDMVKVRDYCERLFYLLAELGVTMLVFGSGAAKQVPDGFPMEKAWEQLFEVGALFSDTALKYGQTIAVEALRHSEVNIVNTIDEAAYYADTVNRDNFKILADFYHMEQNGEPLEVLEKYRDKLVHVHIANPDREMTGEADHEYVKARINILKKIGYTGGVSFEGKLSEDFSGVREMLDFYRKCACND